jgi:hypothetical protein
MSEPSSADDDPHAGVRHLATLICRQTPKCVSLEIPARSRALGPLSYPSRTALRSPRPAPSQGLLIDCEEADVTAVLVGMLREAQGR